MHSFEVNIHKTVCIFQLDMKHADVKNVMATKLLNLGWTNVTQPQSYIPYFRPREIAVFHRALV